MRKIIAFMCMVVGSHGAVAQWMEGICVVAPPEAMESSALEPLHELGAEWLAIVPYGYSLMDEPRVHYDAERQWWGERTEGVVASIEMAQALGHRVFLKPHVYVPGSWPGGLDYGDRWAEWEDSYRAFILHWAQIAAEHEVDLLSVGTEFKISSVERADWWKSMIKEIRAVYTGPITYCANWDEYHMIDWWSAVDYIGIDAYFPLVEDSTPRVSELQAAWKRYMPGIKKIHHRYDRPILFTEYGYLSVDHAGHRTWELEQDIRSRPINEAAQAHAIDALLSFWSEIDWWAGGFYWKWFPGGQGHEGYPERDYSFQGKQAEAVIRSHYQGDKPE